MKKEKNHVLGISRENGVSCRKIAFRKPHRTPLSKTEKTGVQVRSQNGRKRRKLRKGYTGQEKSELGEYPSA